MTNEQRRLIAQHTYACLQLLFCYLTLSMDTNKHQEAEQQYAVACDTYLERSEKKVWA